MTRQIIKQIWTERRHNGWLLLELSAVFFFLLVMADFLWVKGKNYYEPKGFDITDTYVLNLKTLDPIAPGYVAPTEDAPASPAEEVMALLKRIRLYPDVETASLSLHAAPYSMGGYWNGLRADSLSTAGMRCRQVTPSYFDVFRIRTADGENVRVKETGYSQVLLTEDVAAYLFGHAPEAIGREVYVHSNPQEQMNSYRVAAVVNHLKRQEFYPYEQAYFEVLSLVKLGPWLAENSSNVTALNLCVRVREGSARHFEENFMKEMGERLRENNLYVATVTPSARLRDQVVGHIVRTSILPMIYVMLFVLVTVFMGVFGAFWLRTRQRRGEIGIRMAMGAGRRTIRRAMTVESLCLVAIAAVPALLVYLNLLYADILNTHDLPASASRVGIALAVAGVVMTAIITGGTAWPASRAASIPPVDALRDE